MWCSCIYGCDAEHTPDPIKCKADPQEGYWWPCSTCINPRMCDYASECYKKVFPAKVTFVPSHEPTIRQGEGNGWFLDKWVCVGNHSTEGCLQKRYPIMEPIEDEV